MAPTYDIFISYRRDAFESANLFATRLKALGYGQPFRHQQVTANGLGRVRNKLEK